MSTTRKTIKKNIRSLVDKEGGPKAFADKVGVTKQAVNNWVNGASAPDIERLASIAHIYGLNLSSLLTGDDGLSAANATMDKGFIDVPLYGAIAAGTPIEMIEVEGTHPVPAKVQEQHPDAFLLKVEGESMNRILPNGSYALVDPCEDVERDGQPYAVCVNGHNATIKRVRKLNNGFQLVPDSNDPTYATETYNYNEPGTETITIIGRVVYYVLPFDWGF